MQRKTARPTVMAGKLMWNAAVTANCHLERSSTVCDGIRDFLSTAVEPGELTSEQVMMEMAAGTCGAGRGRWTVRTRSLVRQRVPCSQSDSPVLAASRLVSDDHIGDCIPDSAPKNLSWRAPAVSSLMPYSAS